MKNALIFGLAAALCFGINPIFYKLAITGKKVDPSLIMLLFSTGTFIFAIIFFFTVKPNITIGYSSLGYGLLAGIIYGLGLTFVAFGFSKDVPVALMVPVYSMCALITVFLGIFWLKEIPDIKGAIKVIIGSILIVIGVIIVSLYKK